MKYVNLNNAAVVMLVFKLRENKKYVSCWYHYYILMICKLLRLSM